MKQRIASLILIASLISFAAHSQNKANGIIGIWLTSGKEPAKIQIYKSGEKFYGKIIWLKKSNQHHQQIKQSQVRVSQRLMLRNLMAPFLK